jgi:hypothetical protein
LAAAASHAWEELIAPAALRTSGDGDTDARMEAVCTKAGAYTPPLFSLT